MFEIFLIFQTKDGKINKEQYQLERARFQKKLVIQINGEDQIIIMKEL